MAEDGSFPNEMNSTKPYNHTLFDLEGYSVLSQIALTEKENLWKDKSKNGTLENIWKFMVPYTKTNPNG